MRQNTGTRAWQAAELHLYNCASMKFRIQKGTAPSVWYSTVCAALLQGAGINTPWKKRHTSMHRAPRRVQSHRIIRCIRCETISPRLCWCYLQTNPVLRGSKQGAVHSERLLLKAVWHTTCLLLTRPDLASVSFCLSGRRRTLLRPLFLSPAHFQTLHFHTLAPSLWFRPPFDFLPVNLNHIFSLNTSNSPIPLSPTRYSRCNKSYAYARVWGRNFNVSFNRVSIT